MHNLHLYPSTIEFESRIERIANTLKNSGLFHKVYVVGIRGESLPVEEILKNGVIIQRLGIKNRIKYPMSKFFSFVVFNIKLLKFRTEEIAVINCHSLSLLPISVILKSLTGARLVYDTHELETETPSMRGLKQYSFKLLEKYLVDKVDLICVVNCSIGNWYQLKYPQKWIHVQYNYPDLRYSQDNQFVPNLRQSLLIPHESIIVLYQGVLAPNRGLEILIEAAAQLSKTEFTFVIIGKGLLKCELQESSPSNVHFLDFVKPASILSLTRQADVGICLISGESSLSYKLSSPNKIFEYLVSNLYIIASNLPEISKVLSGNDYCSILDELKADTLAEALRSAKQSLKVRRANKLTKKTFLWQSTEMQLVECYRKLLTHP